jgi:monoamine oxidase
VGNLFFCGEHTSLDYQGYMNGASETGERAASEVLAALSLNRSANFAK